MSNFVYVKIEKKNKTRSEKTTNHKFIYWNIQKNSNEYE